MQLIFSILWIFKIACPLEIFKHDWWKGTGRCNPMYAKHYFFKFQNKKKSNALTLTHLSAHWCDSFIFSDKLQQINFLKSYNVRMNLHTTKFFLKSVKHAHMPRNYTLKGQFKIPLHSYPKWSAFSRGLTWQNKIFFTSVFA